MTRFTDIATAFHAGLAYADFMNRTAERLGNVAPEDEPARTRFGYLPINFQRSTRIHRTFRMPDDLATAVAAIEAPQFWMLLTEDWCGDSAQSLPIIARIAEANPHITLRILDRDDHIDIMDRYRTNGGRSIPKLVAFDGDGNECYSWGPRPEPAARLVSELVAEGVDKDERNKRLHLWYGRDRGATIAAELTAVLRRHLRESAA